MRWQLGRRSRNVEDRRGMARPRRISLPGGVAMARGVRQGGLGGVGLLLLLIVGYCAGVPELMLQGDGSGVVVPYSEGPRTRASGDDDQMKQFVATVLGYTEDTWHDLFEQSGGSYREPTLVLFSDQVGSACGRAEAAVGPFYCPADQKVYIDLAFYRQLRDSFGAPGDFAQAYVIAHEVGHHVQNLLGITQEVQAARQQAGRAEANALSVMLELQADCFAGVWAHHTQKQTGFLEEGDLEEGLNAAAAIGDDRLQRRAQGYVVPDAFTHGSSAERVHWFRQGLTTGDVQACDTFNDR